MTASFAPGTIFELKTGPHILVRAIWYLFVGWWLSGLLMLVAYVAGVLIVGLPLSFYLINRLPTVLTLRPRRERYTAVTGVDGVVRQQRVKTEQASFLTRAIYFVLVGWWATALVMFASYLCMLTIVGIPVGLMLVNRLPFVFTLHRGYA